MQATVITFGKLLPTFGMMCLCASLRQGLQETAGLGSFLLESADPPRQREDILAEQSGLPWGILSPLPGGAVWHSLMCLCPCPEKGPRLPRALLLNLGISDAGREVGTHRWFLAVSLWSCVCHRGRPLWVDEEGGPLPLGLGRLLRGQGIGCRSGS